MSSDQEDTTEDFQAMKAAVCQRESASLCAGRASGYEIVGRVAAEREAGVDDYRPELDLLRDGPACLKAAAVL
jgi:hypothetical protein